MLVSFRKWRAAFTPLQLTTAESRRVFPMTHHHARSSRLKSAFQMLRRRNEAGGLARRVDLDRVVCIHDNFDFVTVVNWESEF